MNNLALIKKELWSEEKVINAVLGDKEKTIKFLATAYKVATSNNLKDCSIASIREACVNIATLNLSLSPALQQVYLVPYKAKIGGKYTKVVQMIISARGYNALLARFGWSLKYFVVREGDKFSYKLENFDEKIEYERNLDSDGKLKYAVAMAKAPNGELFIEVMNKAQIEKHRKVSPMQGEKPSGVWANWYNEMALKTAVKKLAKKLPLNEEIAEAVYKDDKEIIPEQEQKIEEQVEQTSLNDLLLEDDEVEIEATTTEGDQNE